jgi:hypothetical protein
MDYNYKYLKYKKKYLKEFNSNVMQMIGGAKITDTIENLIDNLKINRPKQEVFYFKDPYLELADLKNVSFLSYILIYYFITKNSINNIINIEYNIDENELIRLLNIYPTFCFPDIDDFYYKFWFLSDIKKMFLYPKIKKDKFDDFNKFMIQHTCQNYITNIKYRNLLTSQDLDKNRNFDEDNLIKIEEQKNIIKCINYIRNKYQILHNLFIDNLYILYMNINLTNLYEINVDPITQIINYKNLTVQPKIGSLITFSNFIVGSLSDVNFYNDSLLNKQTFFIYKILLPKTNNNWCYLGSCNNDNILISIKSQFRILAIEKKQFYIPDIKSFVIIDKSVITLELLPELLPDDTNSKLLLIEQKSIKLQKLNSLIEQFKTDNDVIKHPVKDPNRIHIHLDEQCPKTIDNNFKYNEYIAYLTKDKIPIPITNTNRNMIILYGIPCSGKSTILNKMLANKEIKIDLTNTIIIDPDAARIFSDDFSKIITGEYYYNTLSDDEKKLFEIEAKDINGLILNFYLYKGKFIPTYKDSVLRSLSVVRNIVQNFNPYEAFNIIYDTPCINQQFCIDTINKTYKGKYQVYVNLIGVFVPIYIVKSRCNIRNYDEGRYTSDEFINHSFNQLYNNLAPKTLEIMKLINDFKMILKIIIPSVKYNHCFYIDGVKSYAETDIGVLYNNIQRILN